MQKRRDIHKEKNQTKWTLLGFSENARGGGSRRGHDVKESVLDISRHWRGSRREGQVTRIQLAAVGPVRWGMVSVRDCVATRTGMKGGPGVYRLHNSFHIWMTKHFYFERFILFLRWEGHAQIISICLMNDSFLPRMSGGTRRVNCEFHRAAVQLVKCICQQNYYCHPQINTTPLTLKVNWEALAVTQNELSCWHGDRMLGRPIVFVEEEEHSIRNYRN